MLVDLIALCRAFELNLHANGQAIIGFAFGFKNNFGIFLKRDVFEGFGRRGFRHVVIAGIGIDAIEDRIEIATDAKRKRFGNSGGKRKANGCGPKDRFLHNILLFYQWADAG